jgi:hypothetical protein
MNLVDLPAGRVHAAMRGSKVHVEKEKKKKRRI